MPNPRHSEEALNARADRAEARLARAAQAAAKAFSHQLMLAQDRRAFAHEQLVQCRALLDELRPHLGHNDADQAFAQTALRSAIYIHLHAMMTVEMDCHAFNLELAERPAMLDHEQFRFAQHKAPYQIARVNLDLALAQYYWMRHLTGIDALLRACRGERAVEPATSADEAAMQAATAKLRGALKADREAAMAAAGMAEGLAEARELIKLGLSRQKTLASGTPQLIREVLRDEGWKMLDAKLQTLLGDLPLRAAPYPALAPLFADPDPIPLPFAVLTHEVIAPSQPKLAPKPKPKSSTDAMKAAMAAAAANKRPSIQRRTP